MRMFYSVMSLLALMLCSFSVVQAGELLDVKPVVTGNSVSVEVTADVSMTYTYYKVPGQVSVVVDIADADPEKVEPLIIVNKGVLSNISVDKAQISGMLASRLVFNLMTESDIFVKPSPDRKLLTVTFGGTGSALAKSVPEPDVKKTAPATAAVGVAPPAVKAPKLEPVVPIGSRPSATLIRKIVVGDSHIDIVANGQVSDFKVFTLSKPERLVIDLRGVKKSSVGKSVSINKFGISKVRVGLYPEYFRVVFDTNKSQFPKYTVTNSQDGLRIHLK